METYTRCLLRHKETHLYIGRGYDHVTRRMESSKTMSGAIRFSDISNASEWILNAPMAPVDPQNYEYVTIRFELNEEEVTPHERMPTGIHAGMDR